MSKMHYFSINIFSKISKRWFR